MPQPLPGPPLSLLAEGIPWYRIFWLEVGEEIAPQAETTRSNRWVLLIKNLFRGSYVINTLEQRS